MFNINTRRSLRLIEKEKTKVSIIPIPKPFHLYDIAPLHNWLRIIVDDDRIKNGQKPLYKNVNIL